MSDDFNGLIMARPFCSIPDHRVSQGELVGRRRASESRIGDGRPGPTRGDLGFPVGPELCALKAAQGRVGIGC